MQACTEELLPSLPPRHALSQLKVTQETVSNESSIADMLRVWVSLCRNFLLSAVAKDGPIAFHAASPELALVAAKGMSRACGFTAGSNSLMPH